MRKKPVGRPEKQEYEKKNKRLNIRMTSFEYDRMVAMAQNRGVSATELIRKLLQKEYGRQGW